MSKKEEVSLWTRIGITLNIKNRVVGGTPTDPKLIAGWIGANMPEKDAAEREKLATATLAELPALTEEKAEGMWTTFKRDDSGIFIEGRQAKAMLRESANILRELLIKADRRANGDAGKSRYTNLKSKFVERCFVENEKIYFTREKKHLLVVDGNEERAIHVFTPQGPRTALKRFDYVNAPASLSFTCRFLNDGVVDLELIKTILEHSSWNGIGADRSQGNGLFEVGEVKEI